MSDNRVDLTASGQWWDIAKIQPAGATVKLCKTV